MKIKPRSKIWRFFNSWWVLLTFVFFLNWVAFMYISAKTKKKAWAVWGLVYAIPFILLLLEVYDEKSAAYDYLFFAAIIGTVISVIHALNIRKEYLSRLQYRKAYEAEMERHLAYDYNPDTEDYDDEDYEYEDDEDYEEDEDTEDSYYEEEEVAASQIEEATLSSSSDSLLDLNVATEEQISDLPGVGIILAKKAIKHREESGKFHSVEEFFQLLQLKQYAIDRIRPLVVVIESPSLPPQTNRRRLVDY